MRSSTRRGPSALIATAAATTTVLCMLSARLAAQEGRGLTFTPTVGFAAPSTVLDAPWELNFPGSHASKSLRVRLDGRVTYGAMLQYGFGSPGWRLRAEYSTGPGQASFHDCYYDGIQCWDMRADASTSQLSLALARRFAPRWSGGLGLEASAGLASSRLHLDHVVQSPAAPAYDERALGVELGGAMTRRLGRHVEVRVDGRVSRVRVDLERFERYWLADDIGGTVYFQPFGSAQPTVTWGLRGGLSLQT